MYDFIPVNVFMYKLQFVADIEKTILKIRQTFCYPFNLKWIFLKKEFFCAHSCKITIL